MKIRKIGIHLRYFVAVFLFRLAITFSVLVAFFRNGNAAATAALHLHKKKHTHTQTNRLVLCLRSHQPRAI